MPNAQLQFSGIHCAIVENAFVNKTPTSVNRRSWVAVLKS